MENQWKTLAKDNQRAVTLLIAHQCWRSAVSRAYYCAYAQLVASLLAAGVIMPRRGNPAHDVLPTLVLNNLHALDHPQRGDLSGKLMTLYRLRINADYGPAHAVNESDTRVASGCMAAIITATTDLV